MAVLEYEDGSFVGKNLLEIATWTHILTWIFQVMPIFFIVGGFTNAGSWRSASRRGVSYATWLRARSARLLGPALVFVAFWTLLPMLAVLMGLPSGMRSGRNRRTARRTAWEMSRLPSTRADSTFTIPLAVPLGARVRPAADGQHRSRFDI